MTEKDFKGGAIKLHPLHRWWHKKFRRGRIGAALEVDWNKGYDVRNIIGDIKIKNQGSNYSCSGQAGSYFLEIQRRLQNIKETPCSAKSIYAPIAYSGGGTTVSSLMSQICAHGANLEASVPSYDAYGNPLPEYLMTEKSWMTPDTIEDAENRAGYIPIDCKETIDDVASTIQQCGACLWEIEGQNNGTWTSVMPQPPSKNNPNEIWRHFQCLIGFQLLNGEKTIISLQSEGEGWGNKGIQMFQSNYFDSGHIVDAFSFLYDPKVIPNSDNQSVWAWLWRWFMFWRNGVVSRVGGLN